MYHMLWHYHGNSGCAPIEVSMRKSERMRKLTLSLSERDYKLIEKLAHNNGMGKADVVRDAVKLKDYFQTEAADGAKVLLQRGDEAPMTELPFGKLL